MSAGYVVIEWPQLALSASFLLVAAGLSLRFRLGLQRDLVVGAVRCVVQLLCMGYLLQWIFGVESALLVLALFAIMGLFAARIAGQRVREHRIPFYWPSYWAIQISFLLVTFVLARFIVQADPWWAPQYVIPLGGMVAGNAMNTIALTLDRFFSDLHAHADEVELRLALGATPAEAGEDLFRTALRTGMIPSINSLMGVGLVSLPGMMTGQILAGAAPNDAVRYQIMVMVMLVATTALTSFLALSFIRKRCFGPGQNLLLRNTSRTE